MEPLNDSTRPLLTWVTNFDAPYRRPVWDQLARTTDLTVLLTSDSGSVEASARGVDWFTQGNARTYRTAQGATRTRRVLGRDMALARRSTRELLPTNGYVVLGGWESPVYWQLAAQARRRSNRVVGFYESTPESQRFRRGPVAWARRAFFQYLDAVIVPGSKAEAAIRAMGVEPDRIHIGMNPVDVEIFQEAAARRGGHTPGTQTGHRYLYVGQLIARKNVASLIRAFELVARPGDSLTIVGSGPLQSTIEDEARNCSGVEVLPHVPYREVPALMAEHHTLVLPSHEEVWGLVVNEALAAGLHVVVSQEAGVASAVGLMAGVWVCRADVDSLATAMGSSRQAWSGWIDEPEIASHTPLRFAAVVRQALGLPSPPQA